MRTEWDINKMNIKAAERNESIIIIYRKDIKGQKSTLRAIIKCKNGGERDILWKEYILGNCFCRKECCRLEPKIKDKKWNGFDVYYKFFKYYGITIIDTPFDTNSSVLGIDKDGYKVPARVANILQKVKCGRIITFDRFGLRNPNQNYNIELYCKLNNPDYIYYPNTTPFSVKDEVIFKYLGNSIKKNTCRYFKTTIDLFINGGVGHPNLTLSKGELKVKDYLIKNNFKFKSHFGFSDCRNKNPLKFDFAIFMKDNLIGLIEFDGLQHEKEVTIFSNSSLKDRQYNDNIKNEYCLKNKIPLLRIKYNEINKIDSIISKTLNVWKNQT